LPNTHCELVKTAEAITERYDNEKLFKLSEKEDSVILITSHKFLDRNYAKQRPTRQAVYV
jgi:hypothetical protein